MLLKMIRSKGLSHLSYVLADGGTAAVVDPRRDCDVYIDIAHGQGAQIQHIFETHRNEDYVIGSTELAQRTGAEIHHGKGLPFEYGHGVAEGDTFDIGDLTLRVLETPGHTDESISIAVADRGFGSDPVAVFTGDALFIGDVGRTDFFPERAEEVAGLLYDSIFEKILPLGDQVILYPAHGAGSVCGSGMAKREFSTIGYERKNNPRLQMKREEFIAYKVNEHHYQPPYFRRMEEYNLKGAPPMERMPIARPCNADEFAKAMEDGMVALDVRSPEAFAGAHIPGSLAIPLDMVPAFAGYLISYDKAIGLIVEDDSLVKTAVRYLVRIGYDKIVAYLHGGMHEWQTSGRDYDNIPTLFAGDLKSRLVAGEIFTLLDVRGIDEFEQKRLPDAMHVYVGELPDRLGEIPKDRPITTFCGSGQRAIIAASILRNNGFQHVEDCLGSMAACAAIGCPTKEGKISS